MQISAASRGGRRFVSERCEKIALVALLCQTRRLTRLLVGVQGLQPAALEGFLVSSQAVFCMCCVSKGKYYTHNAGTRCTVAPERLLGGSPGQGCLLTALDGLLGVERRWRHEQKGGNEALARLATLLPLGG